MSTEETLDPAIADFEHRWKTSGIPDLYVGSGPEMRERARQVRSLFYPKPVLPQGRVENLQISGQDNNSIALRAFWPVQGQPLATLLYFHGGGFIVGDIDSHEAHCVRIANQTGSVVISVDYRLAPEHPFPAGIEDALTALHWVHGERARFGGAHAPLAVGGDSAGGNFAAVAALAARDAGIALAAQFLLYPATDLSLDHGPVGRLYLGQGAAAEQHQRDWRASPRWASSLAGLAPAIIGVGPYDFLYRDNLAYADALRAAGVAVDLCVYPSLNHGFFSYTAVSEASLAAANDLCERLRALLQH